MAFIPGVIDENLDGSPQTSKIRLYSYLSLNVIGNKVLQALPALTEVVEDLHGFSSKTLIDEQWRMISLSLYQMGQMYK